MAKLLEEGMREGAHQPTRNWPGIQSQKDGITELRERQAEKWQAESRARIRRKVVGKARISRVQRRKSAAGRGPRRMRQTDPG
jgi:hypothetical protein